MITLSIGGESPTELPYLSIETEQALYLVRMSYRTSRLTMLRWNTPTYPVEGGQSIAMRMFNGFSEQVSCRALVEEETR
ncbi:hypothetical protein LAUMK191_05574 [Mycobacterium attenuatum]|nr:hypothetical protein LAUMK191_05574 [Mycobacterium attenuatum]